MPEEIRSALGLKTPEETEEIGKVSLVEQEPIDITGTSQEVEVTAKAPEIEVTTKPISETPEAIPSKMGLDRTKEILSNPNIPPEIKGMLNAHDPILIEGGFMVPSINARPSSKEFKDYNNWLDEYTYNLNNTRLEVARMHSEAMVAKGIENPPDTMQIYKEITQPRGFESPISQQAPKEPSYDLTDVAKEVAWQGATGTISRGLVPLFVAPGRVVSTLAYGGSMFSDTLGQVSAKIDEAIKVVEAAVEKDIVGTDKLRYKNDPAVSMVGNVAAEVGGMLAIGGVIGKIAALGKSSIFTKLHKASGLEKELIESANPNTFYHLSKVAGLTEEQAASREILAYLKAAETQTVPLVYSKLQKLGISRPDKFIEWMTGTLTYSAVSARESDSLILGSTDWLDSIKGPGALKSVARKAVMVLEDAGMGTFMYGIARGLKGLTKINEAIDFGTASKKAMNALNTHLDEAIVKEMEIGKAISNTVATDKLDMQQALKATNMADMTLTLVNKHKVTPVLAKERVKELMDTVASYMGKSTDSDPSAVSLVTRRMIEEAPAKQAEVLDDYVKRITALGPELPDIKLLTENAGVKLDVDNLRKTWPLTPEMDSMIKQYQSADYLKDLRNLYRSDLETKIRMVPNDALGDATKQIYDDVIQKIRSGDITSLDEAQKATFTYVHTANMITEAMKRDLERVTLGMGTDWKSGQFADGIRRMFSEFTHIPDEPAPMYQQALQNSIDELEKVLSTKTLGGYKRTRRLGGRGFLDLSVMSELFIKSGGLGAILGGSSGLAMDWNGNGKIDVGDIYRGALGGILLNVIGSYAFSDKVKNLAKPSEEAAILQRATKEVTDRIQSMKDFGTLLDNNIATVERRVAEGLVEESELKSLRFQRELVRSIEKQLPEGVENIKTSVKVAADEQAIKAEQRKLNNLNKTVVQDIVKKGNITAQDIARELGDVVPEEMFDDPDKIIKIAKDLGEAVEESARLSTGSTIDSLYAGSEEYFKNKLRSLGHTDEVMGDLMDTLKKFYGGADPFNKALHGTTIMKQAIANRLIELANLVKTSGKTPEIEREVWGLIYKKQQLDYAFQKSISTLGQTLGTFSRLRDLRGIKDAALLAKEMKNFTGDKATEDVLYAITESVTENKGIAGHAFDTVTNAAKGNKGAPSILGSVLSYRYSSMLSNYWTWFKNIGDNMVKTGWSVGERATEDILKGDVSFDDSRHYLQGLYNGISNAYAAAKKAYKTGESTLDVRGSKFSASTDLNIKPRELFQKTNGLSEHIIDAIDLLNYAVTNINIVKPGNFLVACDEFHKGLLMSGDNLYQIRRTAKDLAGKGASEESIQATMKSILADPMEMERITANALEFARRGSYTEKLGKGFWGDVAGVMDRHPFTKLFCPFLRINVNMAREAIRRMPVVSAILDSTDNAVLKEFLATGKMSNGMRELSARWTAGGLLMSGMGLAVYNGHATGSMAYRGDKRKMEALGIKPYTIFGYSYEWLGSSRILMSTVADIVELAAFSKSHDVPEEFDLKVQDIAMVTAISLGKVVTLPNVIESATDWSRLGSSNNMEIAERESSKGAANFVTSFVPAHLRQAIKTIDNNMYEARGMADQIMNTLGQSKYQPRVDILGYDMTKTNPQTHPMRQALIAAGIDVKMEEFKTESILGVKLDPDMNREYKQIRGDQLRSHSIYWENPKKLRDSYAKADGYATRKLLKRHPELKENIVAIKEIKKQKEAENLELLNTLHDALQGGQ